MVSERTALLSIYLLGGFQVKREDQLVAGFATDKTRALLAYLATESDRPHRRQSLAGLLWPDYPERSARTSLRTALANLRQVIGDRRANPPFLLITRQTLALNTDSDIWVDLAVLNRLLNAKEYLQPSIDDLEKAVDLYQGPFLEGFTLADSAPFDEWILLQRERLERQMMVALGRLVESYKELGNQQKALLYAGRRVELDPWQDPAQRELMRLLAITGRRAAALVQYHAFQRLLAEELGVEPEKRTDRLYEDIREGKLIESVVAPPVGSLENGRSLPAFLTEDEKADDGEQIFVGRKDELKRLHRHLQKAVSGQGRVVFITGGAGRGKTVLLEEFARQVVSRHQALVARGICNAYSGAGDPYLPFRQALAMLTGDVEDAWAAGRVTKAEATRLWQALPHTVQAIVEVGPDLIETFLRGSLLKERALAAGKGDAVWLPRLGRLVNAKAASQKPVSFEQHILMEQYVRVLERVAQHMPLVVIVEDLHWADRGSIELLLYLGRRLARSRVLVLCAYRPDELAHRRTGPHLPIADVVNELRRLHGEIIIDLAIANPAASRQFVDDLLDAEPNRLGAAFRQALHKRTRGHPLFTVEMLRMLQERGDLVRDGQGRWVKGQIVAWNELPARVEAVIQKRVGRLDPLMYEMLGVASVEGEEFSAQVVSQVLKKSERQVLLALSQELGRKHRLVQEHGELKSGPQHVSLFRFSHHLIQHYTYKSLPAGERRLLHERVAAALEDLYANDIAEVTVKLAYHYSRAEVVRKALHYLTQAGHQARTRYDGEEAVRYYSEALSLLPDDDPSQFPLLAARVEVYDLLAQREAQKADIEAMEAIAIRRGDPARRCDALLARTDFYLVTQPFLAREPAEKARQIALELSDGVREAQALSRLGWAGRLGADFNTSRTYIEEAAERFIVAGLPGEAADRLFMLARRLPGSGEHFFKRDVAERAMTLSQEADDYRLEAVAQKNLAIAYMNWERYSDALLLAEEALEKQADLGDRNGECQTLDVLGVILARRGRQIDAAATLERCLTLAEEIGSDWGVLGAVFGLWNYWYLPNGKYEPFLAFIDQRLRKARANGRDWLQGFFAWVQRVIIAELGRLDDAHVLVQKEDGSARESDPVSYVLVRQFAGAVKSELGYVSAARQDLEEALELAERTTDEYLATWPLVSLANLALIEGGQETWSKGLEQAKKAAAAAKGVREKRQRAEALDVSARLQLALGRRETAAAVSSKVMGLLESHPYLPKPQNYFHTHSLALRSLGREREAGEYLRRAFERVMFVADKFKDASLRQSWLYNVRVNNEIVNGYNTLRPDG